MKSHSKSQDVKEKALTTINFTRKVVGLETAVALGNSMFLRQQYVSGLAWRNSWGLQNRSIDNSPVVPVGSPCHDELMVNLPSVNGWRVQVVILHRHQYSALCLACFWLNNIMFRNFHHQIKVWNVLCWISYMNLVVIQVNRITASIEHSRVGRPSLHSSPIVWCPKIWYKKEPDAASTLTHFLDSLRYHISPKRRCEPTKPHPVEIQNTTPWILTLFHRGEASAGKRDATEIAYLAFC